MSNPNDCNIIFAGTPEFSVPSLRALVDLGLCPSIVMTQPDRKAGRGNKLTESPVKIFAKSKGIPVWQPHSLIDSEFVIIPSTNFIVILCFHLSENNCIPFLAIITGILANFAAIPATLGYNLFRATIRGMTETMDYFALQLLHHLQKRLLPKK